MPGDGSTGMNGQRISHFTFSLQGMTCAEAKEVLHRYRTLPVGMDNGNIDFQTFDGWACGTPTAATAQEENNYGNCTKKSTGQSFTLQNR